MNMMHPLGKMKAQATRTLLRMAVLLGCLLPAVAAQAQFTYTTNNETLTVSRYTGTEKDVVIPDSVGEMPVVGIGDRAFEYYYGLTSIIIPSSVTSIGNYAFLYCVSLTNVTIPSSVTSISGGAFESCSSLTSITIPSSITNISSGMFCDCSRLTNVAIPGSVISIGSTGIGAFESCSSLTSITIPNSVTSIGNNAFARCSHLANVIIPGSVTSIGSGAFDRCSALASVIISGNVTSIGNYAFTYCDILTSVYFLGNAPMPSGNTTVFSCGGVSTPATIYYLSGTTGWGPTFDGRPTVALLATKPPVIQDNQATLNWTAMPGKACRVEYRADLTSGDWITVTNLTATQLNMSLTLPVTGRQGFYRIGMEP